MKVIVLNPPNYHTPLQVWDDWINREDRHSGVGYVMFPLTVCSIVGTIRKYAPSVSVSMFDARVYDIGYDYVKEYLFKQQPDLIVCLVGVFSIKNDKPYTEFPIPTIGVICPTSADVREAIKLFDLRSDYFTCTTDLEYTIACAAEEYRQTGKIKQTPGLLIRQGTDLIETGVLPSKPLRGFGFPAYDLLDIDRYFAWERRIPHHLKEFSNGYATLQFAKGCRFHCTFCSNCLIPPDIKDPEQIAEEIRYFYDNYHCQNFDFVVSEFTMDLNKAKEICRQIIKRRLSIRWTTNDRVDLVDEDLIALMKEAGCIEIRYGIETTSPKVRNKILRYQDDETIERVFGWCRKYGIRRQANFIVGLPGEQPADQEGNIALVKKIKPNLIGVTPIILDPGSLLYRQLKAEDRITDYDWSKYKGNIDDRDGMFFRHEHYRDYRHILRVRRETVRRMSSIIGWRNLWVNETRDTFLYRFLYWVTTWRIAFDLLEMIRRNEKLLSFLRKLVKKIR